VTFKRLAYLTDSWMAALWYDVGWVWAFYWDSFCQQRTVVHSFSVYSQSVFSSGIAISLIDTLYPSGCLLHTIFDKHVRRAGSPW